MPNQGILIPNQGGILIRYIHWTHIFRSTAAPEKVGTAKTPWTHLLKEHLAEKAAKYAVVLERKDQIWEIPLELFGDLAAFVFVGFV